MALAIAKNGNSSGPSDPNYVYFPAQQSGVLLPSMPYYPDWLPQLQLSTDGALTFWNYPKSLKKLIVSNPAKKGTFQFLCDLKVMGNVNKPPVGINSDLDFSGSHSGYAFQQTTTIQTPAPSDFLDLYCSMFNFMNGLGPTDQGYQDKGQWLAAGPNRAFPISPQQWVWLNIQYYIVKYLNKPYAVSVNIPYTDNWEKKFSNAVLDNNAAKFLQGCNFLVQPSGGPGFWDKVIAASPIIITAIAGIMTLGAATPALTAAIAATGAGAKLASSSIAKGAAAAVSSQIVNQKQQSINQTAIQGDIDYYTSWWYNLPDEEKKYVYAGGAVVILLALYLSFK